MRLAPCFGLRLSLNSFSYYPSLVVFPFLLSFVKSLTEEETRSRIKKTVDFLISEKITVVLNVIAAYLPQLSMFSLSIVVADIQVGRLPKMGS